MWSEKTTACRIFSCQRIAEAFSLAAAGGPPSPCRAPAQPLLSKLTGSRRSQQVARLTVRPASLARTCDCYISDTEVQAEVAIYLTLPKSTFAAARLRRTTSGLARRGLPTVARFRSVHWQPSGSRAEVLPAEAHSPVHLRAARYGGHHPSPAFMSEGWWRIPGSNR